MTFIVKPIFESEFRDAALVFAKDADADAIAAATPAVEEEVIAEEEVAVEAVAVGS